LPDTKGFAGPFSGVHNGALIVAGGANFPHKPPAEGGAKVWYDSVFVLEKPNDPWKTGFKLPRPLGYGVSIAHKDGVICIGGSDARQHYADVFLMSWSKGEIHFKTLPKLPKPCSNMCGALLENKIYLAGGLETPTATNALQTFWSLDLNNTKAGWKELEPWPGRERMFAVAGAFDGAFYLFSGAALQKGTDGKLVREWLRDAYCYTPGRGWKRIADLPRAVVGAPSPATILGDSLLILGGDDGSQVNALPTEHRGFSRVVLSYNPKLNEWKKISEMPFGLVTTPSVNWNGRIIIPGGEARPGVRSTEVWDGTPVRSP